MPDRASRQVIADLTGGRNGYDAPQAIGDRECVDAVNVDFYKARLANKRGGMQPIPATGSPFTGTISSLFRHVPGTSEAAAELWAVDDAATPTIGRLAGGAVWSTPTLTDAPTGTGWDITAASINGKLALSYKSAQNRLPLWDGSTVRRSGLVQPSTPTAANTGAGAYPATLRYYRVRGTVQAIGITIRRSEPSAYLAVTPSGTGSALRVTRPALGTEGETHWELEGSDDSVTFYRLATMAIGTTTYDDAASVSSYSNNPLSDLTGKYTLQKAYKFVKADQNRLLGFGSWTSTDKQSRIEISAVIGSSDIGDEERVDTTINYYIDLDENDSGVATGLHGPVFGSYFAFKDRQVWQLTPTGSTAQPYRQDAISKSVGAIAHYAIATAEDALGNTALYWMSHRGPYRWSVNGLEYIGRNIEDYVTGPSATINLNAPVPARAVYHADKRQVWFWWATGSATDPNVGFLYDVQTGGWSRIPTSDALANVRCAVLFANTIGASMSRDLKPYVGQTGGANRIWKADTGTTDNGTPFQAYVITKAAEPGGAGFFGEVRDVELLAKAAAGVTITDTITADYGVQSVTGTASLTPDGSETRVTRRIEGSGLAGNVRFIQHQIGDVSAVANTWTLDRLTVVYSRLDAVA
jgi:hypothetical protein